MEYPIISQLMMSFGSAGDVFMRLIDGCNVLFIALFFIWAECDLCSIETVGFTHRSPKLSS